jgi:hypothetical protein
MQIIVEYIYFFIVRSNVFNFVLTANIRWLISTNSHVSRTTWKSSLDGFNSFKNQLQPMRDVKWLFYFYKFYCIKESKTTSELFLCKLKYFALALQMKSVHSFTRNEYAQFIMMGNTDFMKWVIIRKWPFACATLATELINK